MEQKVISLDLERHIGHITLSDNETVIDIPKLTMSKIIRIVKFLGIDGLRLYSESRDILIDENLDDLEKVATVLENLKEEQLIHLLSICLDLPDREVLKLDPNETLEIMVVYAEKVDLKKTFFLVRKLLDKMFGIQIPENMKDWIKDWTDKRIKAQEEIQKKRNQAVSATSKAESTN